MDQKGMSLNVHLTVPTTTATTTEDGSHTPNTPEILNTILSMSSGPFGDYSTTSSSSSVLRPQSHVNLNSPDSSESSSIADSNFQSSPGSSIESPASAMTVQQYRSQFIKEGLKMKVQQKLGTIGVSPLSSPVNHQPSGPSIGSQPQMPMVLVSSPTVTPSIPKVETEVIKVKREILTPEDEERRLRRRERNKVAATKCRNKKKLKTTLLMKDHEITEKTNSNLKSEMSRLEAEKKRLMSILDSHKRDMNCSKRQQHPTTSTSPLNEFRVPEIPSLPSSTTNSLNIQTSRASSILVNEKLVDPLSEFMNESDDGLMDTSSISLNDGINEDHITSQPPFSRSCSFSDNNFLGKSSINTYMDLDSRCIAL